MLYIAIKLRTMPIHLTIFWVNIRGLFNPTPIDRANKSISNIRLTYKDKAYPNRAKKLIFSTKRLIRLTLLSSIVFKKSKLDHKNPLS